MADFLGACFLRLIDRNYEYLLTALTRLFWDGLSVNVFYRRGNIRGMIANTRVVGIDDQNGTIDPSIATVGFASATSKAAIEILACEIERVEYFSA